VTKLFRLPRSAKKKIILSIKRRNNGMVFCGKSKRKSITKKKEIYKNG